MRTLKFTFSNQVIIYFHNTGCLLCMFQKACVCNLSLKCNNLLRLQSIGHPSCFLPPPLQPSWSKKAGAICLHMTLGLLFCYPMQWLSDMCKCGLGVRIICWMWLLRRRIQAAVWVSFAWILSFLFLSFSCWCTRCFRPQMMDGWWLHCGSKWLEKIEDVQFT